MLVNICYKYGGPSGKVDCFTYLVLQVAADGGCESYVVHRMNKGYRAWGVQRSMNYRAENWQSDGQQMPCLWFYPRARL